MTMNFITATIIYTVLNKMNSTFMFVTSDINTQKYQVTFHGINISFNQHNCTPQLLSICHLIVIVLYIIFKIYPCNKTVHFHICCKHGRDL